jgi:HIRAN domain
MLRKLREAIQPPTPAGSESPASQPTTVMLSGGLEVGVVGESHYQEALIAIAGGKSPESVRISTQAILVPESDNPYDPNAVAVYIDGRKVGHLPRPAARRPSRRLAVDWVHNDKLALFGDHHGRLGSRRRRHGALWSHPRPRPSRPADVEHQLTSRMLGIDLDGSRRIEPAHVGCLVGPEGSRRTPTDRVDDHRDDQGASDTRSDAKQAWRRPGSPGRPAPERAKVLDPDQPRGPRRVAASHRVAATNTTRYGPIATPYGASWPPMRT